MQPCVVLHSITLHQLIATYFCSFFFFFFFGVASPFLCKLSPRAKKYDFLWTPKTRHQNKKTVETNNSQVFTQTARKLQTTRAAQEVASRPSSAVLKDFFRSWTKGLSLLTCSDAHFFGYLGEHRDLSSLIFPGSGSDVQNRSWLLLPCLLFYSMGELGHPW